METTRVDVESEERGRRLDRLIADRLEISRARVRHLLEAGRIRCGERTLSLSDKSHSAEAGEVFEVAGALRAEEERAAPRSDLDLDVLATGVGWVVVDKPAGRGVHPLRPEQEDTVLNALIARSPEIDGVGEGGLRSGVVHRLDVDTTGALAFATDEIEWKRLRGAFSDHRVDKRYRAIVAGKFEREQRVDLPLLISRHQPAHVDVNEKGRPCRQHVTPIEIFERATLVEINLATGFLHQIRATMAHLGHPVLGDAEYGGIGEISPVEVPRQMLHAWRLGLDEIEVEAPIPADFQAALDQLSS